jgi:hypothetical protein
LQPPAVPITPPANAFYVTHYGADPTGHADSAVAIRAAIAAAQQAGGNQTVYFPAGTYLLDDTSDTTKRGVTHSSKDSGVPIDAELYVDGSNGAVVNFLGAGAGVTKIVDAVGITNPKYQGTLKRGYDAFVIARMNGFFFSGLTVDSATYSAGDALEEFGSDTLVEDSVFDGSQTSTATVDPDVFGLRVTGICKAVPASNGGAEAGYTGPEFHFGNVIKDVVVSGDGTGGNSDLGIACQRNDTISNVTDTGWGMAIYVDYGITVNGDKFTPGRNQNTHPGFYITDSSHVTINGFVSSGAGGIISSTHNLTYDTTISDETMTGSGFALQIKNADNTVIDGSVLNELEVSASVGVDGLNVTDTRVAGASSSPDSPPSVTCRSASSAKITGLTGVRCAG